MRILHLIYDHLQNPWVGGGGAVRAWEIYRRLADRHHVTVVCGKYPGSEDYREENVNFHFEGTAQNNYVLSTFCYGVEARRFLADHGRLSDVIIEDFAPYNPLLPNHAGRDIPVILQVHQKEGFRHFKKYGIFGAPFFLIEHLYPRFFRNSIAISDTSRDKFRLGERGAVIPNGFDSGLLDGEPIEDESILYLGRLHINQKGLDILHRALRYTPCKLRIAGSGKDEYKVRELFSELAGSGLVEMMGFVSGADKTRLLSNCKFLVLPSRYEGQPLTVIEAAACGKPVIVSDIPDLRYAVEAGFGLSFRSGDAKDLARKIEFLLRDEALRQEMGRKGREYARNFTWDKIAEEYEEYLTSVVDWSVNKG